MEATVDYRVMIPGVPTDPISKFEAEKAENIRSLRSIENSKRNC